MWSMNVITDQKSTARAKILPLRPRASWRIRTYWHMRYVRMSGGRMRYVMRQRVSGIRIRLRKARGYYAHTQRRIMAGLRQHVVRPYVRLALLTDYCL